MVESHRAELLKVHNAVAIRVHLLHDSPRLKFGCFGTRGFKGALELRCINGTTAVSIERLECRVYTLLCVLSNIGLIHDVSMVCRHCTWNGRHGSIQAAQVQWIMAVLADRSRKFCFILARRFAVVATTGRSP